MAPARSGTIAPGGGGNAGFSRASSCEADNAYDCASFRICAAASWRFASLAASRVSRDFFSTAEASGSFRAAFAASRFACALASVRGMDTWAEASESEACASHFDAPSL
ncbi:hypothetical protein [Streptomyces sp. NRRL S-4]|uniref:hypothetical protein n=1 Tax=Streptomyces sp. NRRL S-4 TaxID=1519471 RepID=UPI0006B4212D|nr:hypothetical protein [Streptomyces sp. NRRL S-4]KPC82608.1 hypothetical protein ADK82_11250 [Streptomyces sp. NRRL S-4]